MASEQESQSLCLACGLCCNGALHGRTIIADNEIHKAAELGLEIELSVIPPGFKQPCVMFVGNCCNIYAQRPTSCQVYRCALLEKYEAGRVTYEEAMRVVDQGRSMYEAVLDSLPEGITVAQLRNILRIDNQKTTDWYHADENQPVVTEALLHFVVLSWHLDRFFRKPNTLQESNRD